MDFSIKYASQAWARINFYITQSWEIANTVLWESLWNYQPTWVGQKQIMESFGEAKNWKPKVLKANFSYNLGAPSNLVWRLAMLFCVNAVSGGFTTHFW